jgi:hypothetical protein
MAKAGDRVWYVLDRFANRGQPRPADVVFGHIGPAGPLLDLNVILHPDDNPVPQDPDSTRTHLVVKEAPQTTGGNVPGTWYE